MIKEAIDRILGLAEVKLHDIDGRQYAERELKTIAPPLAPTSTFHTLDGFATFAALFADGATGPGEAFVHVVDHGQVGLMSLGTDEWERRDLFAVTTIDGMGKPFPFGTKLDVEEFIIALQAMFVDTPERALLLGVVGNMTTERVQTSDDDGVTQTVGQRAGVVLKSKVTAPNPIPLRPYRTFREVTQPASKFVFRVHQGRDGELPKCALYEADGGFWRIEAAGAVAAYLAKAMPGWKVLT